MKMYVLEDKMISQYERIMNCGELADVAYLIADPVVEGTLVTMCKYRVTIWTKHTSIQSQRITSNLTYTHLQWGKQVSISKVFMLFGTRYILAVLYS